MKNSKPDYKIIYSDILHQKFPDKKTECQSFLEKETLSVLDILELNDKIFGAPDKQSFISNQKHRSYNKSDIVQILKYQKKHKLSNNQLANQFKLSRNSVTRWKKMFLV